MLSLTRKTDYALVAMAKLASHEEGTISAREIAEACRLPLPVLMNILTQLTHAGLVVSVRGAKGGYRLARRAEDINLTQLIEAIEGPMRLTLCCSDERPVDETDCNLEDVCPVKRPIQRVHRKLHDFLNGTSLAELLYDQPPDPRSELSLRVIG